jgi:tetratricopeptide (TPR) repeat protein/transcriptional regulator with XRE-family HTH domain
VKLSTGVRAGPEWATPAAQAGAYVFGEQVREYRRRLGLTQEDLGRKATVDPKTIRSVETGRRTPRPSTVQQLADALGLGGKERERFVASAARRSGRANEYPSRPLTPAQLPPDIATFTGRDVELARLDELLAETGGPAVPIAVICGLPGIGKTALAVHWAHTARLRFPDGQLYIDLRGFAPQPSLPSTDALGALLRGVGARPEDIPIEPAYAMALFRSMVSGRRLLIVLDNAHDAGQVRPMLPGDPGCLVLVTSRNGLSGLIARDGARRIELGVLPLGEAIELLRRTAGHGRIAAEPDAAAALAEACGRLPLALRIAAAHLGDRPHQSIDAQVGDLRGAAGLAALELEGDADSSIRAAFALSYQDQAPAARRMFRLLALAPGPDLGVEAVAALAAEPIHAARLLERLVSAHLVQRSEAGRYGLHDLLRRYSGELVRAEEPQAQCDAAVQRLMNFYVYTADEAIKALGPDLVRMPIPPTAAAHLSFASASQARAWLEAEQPSLVAAVRRASTDGPAPAAWLIADRLRSYFWISRDMGDWLATAEAAMEAAIACGNVQAHASARISLGVAYICLGQYRISIDHLDRGLALSREAGWAAGEACALGRLAIAQVEIGDNRTAMGYFIAALELNRSTGRRGGEASTLTNLGNLRLELGDLRGAMSDLGAALALHREIGTPSTEAITLSTRAVVHVHLGDLDAARHDLVGAQTLNMEIDNRYGQPFTDAGLAMLHCAAGDPEAGERYARMALEAARDIGDRRAELTALVALGDALLRLDAVPAAIVSYEEAVRLDGRDNSHAGCEARTGLAKGLLRAGDLDRALAEATTAYVLTGRARYAIPKGRALTTIAEVHLTRGNATEAVRHAKRAIRVLHRTGCRQAEAEARTVLTVSHERGAEAVRGGAGAGRSGSSGPRRRSA